MGLAGWTARLRCYLLCLRYVSFKGLFNKIWEEMKSKYEQFGTTLVGYYPAATKSQKTPLFTNDRISSSKKTIRIIHGFETDYAGFA